MGASEEESGHPEGGGRITTEIWAAIILIAAPLWFNFTFALLGRRFDYPDILRRPTEEILERFRAGGPSLILLWWAFMLSGLLMIGAAVVLSQALGFRGVLPVATTIGVLAGLVQMLGLLRWVYLVPNLARAYADPQSSPVQREATAVIFRAFHQYLGVVPRDVVHDGDRRSARVSHVRSMVVVVMEPSLELGGP